MAQVGNSALPERFTDRLAIEQLNRDFCHQLDRGDADGFVDLFVADALYTNGPRVLRGHAQIREFYLGRTRNSPRTSRHFLSPLRLDFLHATAARGVSAGFTFSADALPPVDSTLPAIVADFNDVYALDGSVWRFAERHIVPVFRRS